MPREATISEAVLHILDSELEGLAEDALLEAVSLYLGVPVPLRLLKACLTRNRHRIVFRAGRFELSWDYRWGR